LDERIEVIHTDPRDAPRGVSRHRDGAGRSKALAVLSLLLAALAGVTGYVWWMWVSPPTPARVADVAHTPQPQAQAPASAAPSIAHPLGPAIADAATAERPEAPLPSLADSDPVIRPALLALAGAGRLAPLLVPDSLVRRIVATVDNLPRAKAPIGVWPVHPAPGSFTVAQPDANEATIAPANAARYGAYMAVADAVDPRTLVDAYVRFYPLFQRAYEELGFAHGYFNDRVIAAIDDLLAAPESPEPIRLTQAKVLYEFADPALEPRSAGQKIMLRIGAENEARMKARLREIRREIVRREAPR
jgi:hypothetical protein